VPVILPSTAFRPCPRYSQFPRPPVPTGWGSRSIRIGEVANRCRSTPRSFPRGSRKPSRLPGTAPGRRPVGHGKPGGCVSSAVFRGECRGHRAVDSSRMVDEARGISRRPMGAIVRPGEKTRGSGDGPVSRVLSRVAISLGCRLPGTSSDRPGSHSGPDRPDKAPCLILLPVGFTKPNRSPGSLVRSYRTVSPLPPGTPKSPRSAV